MDGGSASFREVQGFRQWWLWTLLLVSALGTVGLFGYGIYVQLIEGTPWGDRPMSDGGLLATGIGTAVLVVGLAGFILSARLITEVRSDGLYIRFFPLSVETYPLRNHRFVPNKDLSPHPRLRRLGNTVGPGRQGLHRER